MEGIEGAAARRLGVKTTQGRTASIGAGSQRLRQLEPKLEQIGHHAVALVPIDEQEQNRANKANNERINES
jgi:hypothetical protein